MSSAISKAIQMREASDRDSAAILKCLRAAFEPYRESYTNEAYADTTLTAESLQSRLATMRVLVAACDSGEVIGTIAYRVVNPEEGHIRGMAVLPAWKGSGVAAQMLSFVEAELRGLHCSRISLDTTEPLTEAIRFYEKHGFRRSGKVGDFFGLPLIEYVRNLS